MGILRQQYQVVEGSDVRCADGSLVSEGGDFDVPSLATRDIPHPAWASSQRGTVAKGGHHLSGSWISEEKRKGPETWLSGPLPSAGVFLLRGGEQDLFGWRRILSAQLGFCSALGNVIGGSISREFDTRQEGLIAVPMEHQRVRA